MSRTVDYYFTLKSPWAYIGHAAFQDVVRRHGLAVRYVPLSLDEVFPESGGLPLAKRHPLRQRYRMLELQRWREARGLSFHLEPDHWPFDASLADRVMIALTVIGADPESVLPQAFAAVWEGQADLADPTALGRLLAAGGHDPEQILKMADSATIVERYATNVTQALDAGIFGSPSYRLDGEIFWGQDRIDLMEAALASGRAPFRA